MARPLTFLHEQCSKHNAPLVIAGDLFDDGWREKKCPPQLINFAIKHLRMPHGVYAVPGQHDLPNHRYEDIRNSAYWTLVEAEVIENLHPSTPCAVSKEFQLHGFPWGFEIEPFDKRWRDFHEEGQSLSGINLAVVHDYCWSEGHYFPGCEQEKHWTEHAKNLAGYSAAVFGDNHKGFLAARRPKCSILNCGSIMRRNSDQKDYAPKIGLLRSDGGIEMRKIPCQEDTTLDDAGSDAKKEADQTLQEFIEIVNGLGELTADYHEACGRFMRAKKTPKDVQQIVFAVLGQDTQTPIKRTPQ